MHPRDPPSEPSAPARPLANRRTQPDAALPGLEAELAAARDGSDSGRLVAALNALGWALRGRELERSHALAVEARELAEAPRDLLGQARALRTMAMTVVDPSKIARVFDWAEEARRLFDEVGDDLGRAGSRDFLSSIYEYVGDRAHALELALDALDIARRTKDPVRQGYALASLGGLLGAEGETDRALGHLHEALTLFSKAGDADGVGTIRSRAARVLQRAGRVDEAVEQLEACRVLAAELDDAFLLASTLALQADIEVSRGHADEAESLYDQALAAYPNEISRDVVGGDLRVARARLLVARGALDEARADLEELLVQVEGRQISIVPEAEAQIVLADVAKREGRFEAAVGHLERARELEQRLQQTEAKGRISQVEARAKMESARKDAEIQRLRFVELHAMQAKLIESEKMAVLGKLAAGTAHELNSPLGVLQANLQVVVTAAERLAAPQPPSETDRRRLARALSGGQTSSEAAIDRIAHIAQSFRRFTVLDAAERQTFDVREGLDGALVLLEPTLGEGVKLIRRMGAVPPVAGWPRELNHAFMTVLTNGAQAIDGAGEVVAETSFEDGEVVVRITDTGRGMSEAELGALFEPSFGTEGGCTRMKLGLTAAQATLIQHGGRIEVVSEPGRGTTVSFMLPPAR